MRVFNKVLTGCIALILSLPVAAHIGWTSINSVECLNPYVCNNPDAIELEAGATITVVYDVIIAHGGAVQIDFSESGSHGSDNQVLVQGLAEMPGDNSIKITLPDMECIGCSLRVYGSGYSGASIVNLRKSPVTPSAAWNVSSPMASSVDNQITLHWQKSYVAGLTTLVAMSEMPITDFALEGNKYQLGDWIDSAQVVYIGNNTLWISDRLERDTQFYFYIVNFDESLQYSSGVTLEAKTTNIGNNPPEVSFAVMQNGMPTMEINPDDGLVSVRLILSDIDEWDTHVIDWFGTDSRLLDLNMSADGDVLQFDPTLLSSGDYDLTVSVQDSGEPSLSDDEEIVITIKESQSGENHHGGKSKGGTTSLRVLFMLFGLLIFAATQRYKKRLILR